MSRSLLGSGAKLTAPVVMVLALGACAAQRKSGGPPQAASSPASQPVSQQPGGYAASSAPQQPGAYAPPPPAPGPEPGSSLKTPAGGSSGTAQQRSVAFQSAASEVDSSQRELDIAAGDCRNACRALGSMDRAAGKVCELAQGDGEGRRCDDAKTRVYSARARVKNTCGGCPGGPSVERADPIPSTR